MFLTLTCLPWTSEARGQDEVARVGILSFFKIDEKPDNEPWVDPIRRVLADEGWSEGKNVSFEYRSAQSDPSKFSAAAAELAKLDVDVIYALSAPALHAAYSATHKIPIVAVDFTTDPVASGYIKSYARPGGNVTGVFLDAPGFAGKWFELLKAIVPELTHVAVLWDPGPGTNHLDAVRSVAASLSIKLQVLEVRKPDHINTAFDSLRSKTQAVISLPSPMSYNQSTRLARLALEHRLPAVSMFRDFADVGGILTYGPEVTSTGSSIAKLVAKVLSGDKPAEIPVERPVKFQLLVNLKTAKILSLAIPQSILLRADKVIR